MPNSQRSPQTPTPERMAEIREMRAAITSFEFTQAPRSIVATFAPETSIRQAVEFFASAPEIIDELLARLDDYDAREVRLDAEGNEIFQAQSECPHHAPTASRCLTCTNRALHHAMLDNLALHKELQSARADAERITGGEWYCETCEAWKRVEMVRLPQSDAVNIACVDCHYVAAQFMPRGPSGAPTNA